MELVCYILPSIKVPASSLCNSKEKNHSCSYEYKCMNSFYQQKRQHVGASRRICSIRMASGQGFGKNLGNQKNEKNQPIKEDKSDISASQDQDLSDFTVSDRLPPSVDPTKRSKKSGVVLPGEMIVAFTCDVSGCNTRIARRIKKKSYDSGVVLIECPKCGNRHLIADHLGWYPWLTENGGDGNRSLKNLEEIASAKGIHKVELKDIEFEEVVDPGNGVKSMESVE